MFEFTHKDWLHVNLECTYLEFILSRKNLHIFKSINNLPTTVSGCSAQRRRPCNWSELQQNISTSNSWNQVPGCNGFSPPWICIKCNITRRQVWSGCWRSSRNGSGATFVIPQFLILKDQCPQMGFLRSWVSQCDGKFMCNFLKLFLNVLALWGCNYFFH